MISEYFRYHISSSNQSEFSENIG